jgi:hypothetical protein
VTDQTSLSLGRAIVSLSDYGSHAMRHGIRVVSGSHGTVWMSHEASAFLRLPVFETTPPSHREVHQVLWRSRAMLASYLLEPDNNHPANAWLYLCTDQAYALDRLSPSMRRNVRRGIRELRISPMKPADLLVQGVQAFCDTRRRNGLSDGTPAEFLREFGWRVTCPGHVFIGAWKDGVLAAFLSVIEVDDCTLSRKTPCSL